MFIRTHCQTTELSRNPVLRVSVDGSGNGTADSSAPILFHVPFASGEVDEKEGIIRGVSLITGSLTAEGHELEVDDTTLKQVCECAAKMGKAPAKLNHGSGAENICGYIDDFNQDKAERNSDAARRNAPSGSMSPRYLVLALTARACESFFCERREIDAYGHRKAALLTEKSIRSTSHHAGKHIVRSRPLLSWQAAKTRAGLPHCVDLSFQLHIPQP